MFKPSRKTAVKASVVAVASAAASCSIVLLIVPFLGGQPDGPGFWMSVLCPILVGWPASAWQFHQSERLAIAHRELQIMHETLDQMHVQLLRSHAALEQKSRYDSLTGALNREAFLTMLEAQSRLDRKGALLFIDADNFKKINDSFGHQTGDEALAGIARAVRTSLHDSDFWGRIGGEEFAAFLDGVGEAECEFIAESIRLGAAALDIRKDGARVPVTLSIGGIMLKGPFKVNEAVSEADRRLYRAKRNGRNCVVMRIEEPDAAKDVAAA
jgi:diguanylate cyclase (GGDEF)-like protein